MSAFPDRRSALAGALSLALAAALLAGCGGGGGSGSTVSVTVPATAPATSAAPSGGGTATSKHAAPGAGAPKASSAPAGGTTSAPSGASSASSAGSTSSTPASPPPSGRLLHRYTGTGSGRLGTIVVSAPAVLSWHAQQGPIQIFTSSGFLLVQSAAANGSVRLSKGTYRGVRVASRAGWSIELRTRVS
jgi:hypothetical protein